MSSTRKELTISNPTLSPQDEENQRIDEFTDEEDLDSPQGAAGESAGDDGETEEGQDAKVLCKPCMPSQAAIDQRMISHVPFRNWCFHCVKGKRKGKGHMESDRQCVWAVDLAR